MSSSKTVLVLGGGVGGLVAARELRKRLPRRHRVVLIEREREHLFAPSLLWLMVGLRDARAIRRPLKRLERTGIELRLGEVEHIEPEMRRVTVGGEILQGDFLVVALGAELAPDAVPGLAQAGANFYTLQGAQAFRDSLRAFRAGRIVVLTATAAYKCPAAPYEAAMLIDDFCRRHGVRDTVEIAVYAAEPGPMGVAGPEVSTGVKQLLAARNIAYHPEHQVTGVDAAAGRLAFANDASAKYDLLAYVPPHRPPRSVRESGLAGENGWVSVDRRTLVTRAARVYAIGDVVSIPLKLGRPLPKAGVFAHAEAQVVARNIASTITGTGAAASFTGHGACFIEVGGWKAAYGSGDFFAEPVPVVTLHPPAWHWHLGKVLLEKSWLYFRL
jgi:sulfide:quinone oxidoreductase